MCMLHWMTQYSSRYKICGSCSFERHLRTTRILLKLDEIEKKLLPKLDEHPMSPAHSAPPAQEPVLESPPQDKRENDTLQEKVIRRDRAKVAEVPQFH